jgi:hypothetical protein
MIKDCDDNLNKIANDNSQDEHESDFKVRTNI